MIYTSSSVALALLEILVHVKRNQLPPDYVWTNSRSSRCLIERVKAMPADPAEYGTAWLDRRGATVGLAVPSVIIPEPNILLNPNHSDFATIRWAKPAVLTVDRRLK